MNEWMDNAINKNQWRHTKAMEIYEQEGMDRKEAMKKVAADRGISKREVYRELLR